MMEVRIILNRFFSLSYQYSGVSGNTKMIGLVLGNWRGKDLYIRAAMHSIRVICCFGFLTFGSTPSIGPIDSVESVVKIIQYPLRARRALRTIASHLAPLWHSCKYPPFTCFLRDPILTPVPGLKLKSYQRSSTPAPARYFQLITPINKPFTLLFDQLGVFSAFQFITDGKAFCMCAVSTCQQHRCIH